MCFVFIWEQTATCATYSINWSVFITQMKSVYSAVRTGSLNTAVCDSFLKGIRHKFEGIWNKTDQTTEVLWDNVFNNKTRKRTNRYVINMKEWIRCSIIEWMTLRTCLPPHNFSKLEINFPFEGRATNFIRLKLNCVERKTTKFLFTLQVH